MSDPKKPASRKGSSLLGLAKDDMGGLNMGIAADPQNQVVRIAFGVPVAWLAFPPAVAREFAKLLIEAAEKVEQRRT